MIEITANDIIGNLVWGIFTGILFYVIKKIYGFDIEQPLSAIAIVPILFTYMYYFYSALEPMPIAEVVELFADVLIFTVGWVFAAAIGEIASNLSDSITNIIESIF